MGAPLLGPNHAIRVLYCASCQADRELLFQVVGGELVALCKCGRAIKWPLNLTRDQLAQAFIDHARANRGQVKMLNGEEQRHPAMDVVEAL